MCCQPAMRKLRFSLILSVAQELTYALSLHVILIINNMFIMLMRFNFVPECTALRLSVFMNLDKIGAFCNNRFHTVIASSSRTLSMRIVCIRLIAAK